MEIQQVIYLESWGLWEWLDLNILQKIEAEYELSQVALN